MHAPCLAAWLQGDASLEDVAANITESFAFLPNWFVSSWSNGAGQ